MVFCSQSLEDTIKQNELSKKKIEDTVDGKKWMARGRRYGSTILYNQQVTSKKQISSSNCRLSSIPSTIKQKGKKSKKDRTKILC